MNKGFTISKYAKRHNSNKYIRSLNNDELKAYADRGDDDAMKERTRRSKKNS